MDTHNHREEAKSILIAGWEELVECEDMSREEMLESLTAQIYGGCQGWDMSAEELDDKPYLMTLMGYTEDMTDEQIDEWLVVVQEAAMEYILKWEE